MFLKKNPLFFGIVVLMIIVGVVLVLASATNEKRNASQDKQVVKIGAILPLSGNLASIGIPGKNVLELAFEKLNTAQSNAHYSLFFEDSKGQTKDGVTAAQKLLSVDNVRVIFATLSSVSLAIAPLVQQHDAILFASAISTELLKEGDGVFRFFTSTQNEVAVWLDRINEKRFKRVGMLYINAEFSLEEKKLLETNLPDNVSFVAEMFEAKDQDVRTQLTKLKQANPDVLVISGIGSNYVSIVNQIKELHITTSLIGDFDFALSTARNAARTTENGLSLFDGIEFAMINVDQSSPDAKMLLAGYRTKYQNPEYDILNESEALFAYDAAHLLNERVQKIGSFDVRQLKDQLQNVTQYSGVSGNIRITNRSADIPLVLGRYENGEIKIVKKK